MNNFQKVMIDELMSMVVEHETLANMSSIKLLSNRKAIKDKLIELVNEQGDIVVTWDYPRTKILAVTRQDSDGKILKVIAEI